MMDGVRSSEGVSKSRVWGKSLGSASVLMMGSLAAYGCGGSDDGTGPTDITPPAPVSAGAASNVLIEDVGNFGDGRDLRVFFQPAADETKISGYRIIIGRAAAGSLTVEATTALSPSNVTSVAKTGGTLTTTLTESTRDAGGEVLDEGVQYRAYVLSVADGTNADTNSLSSPSASFTIFVREAAGATEVYLEDVANNTNASDLEVAFIPPVQISTVGEFRIFVVKASSASTLDAATADAMPAARYAVHETSADLVVMTLPGNLLDTDGDAIGNGTSYQAFVLSTPDGATAGRSTLSPVSNEATPDESTLKVTYLGNDGVLLSDGQHKVLVDGYTPPRAIGSSSPA